MKIDTHNVCRVDKFVIVDVRAGEFIAGEGNKLLRVVVRAHHIRRVHQAVAVDVALGMYLDRQPRRVTVDGDISGFCHMVRLRYGQLIDARRNVRKAE